MLLQRSSTRHILLKAVPPSFAPLQQLRVQGRARGREPVPTIFWKKPLSSHALLLTAICLEAGEGLCIVFLLKIKQKQWHFRRHLICARCSLRALAERSPPQAPAILVPSAAGHSAPRSAGSPGHLLVCTQDLQALTGHMGLTESSSCCQRERLPDWVCGEPDPGRRINSPLKWLGNCPFFPHTSHSCPTQL